MSQCLASSEIELTPQEFWKRCQSEPWTNLLHIEIPLYSVVEIDDGLLPAFFYRAVDGLKLVTQELWIWDRCA